MAYVPHAFHICYVCMTYVWCILGSLYVSTAYQRLTCGVSRVLTAYVLRMCYTYVLLLWTMCGVLRLFGILCGVPRESINKKTTINVSKYALQTSCIVDLPTRAARVKHKVMLGSCWNGCLRKICGLPTAEIMHACIELQNKNEDHNKITPQM